MNVRHEARILIVDDEFDLRNDLKSALENHFTDVVMVSSYADAIQELQQNEYDVVVCDHKLSSESGLEVRNWQIKHKPNLEFILMTGYARDPEIIERLKRDHFKVLQKPAALHELILPLKRSFPAQKAPLKKAS